jgi:hypothetical protein
MKIKIADHVNFTAFLVNGDSRTPKLEIVPKDSGRESVFLGPNDYIPGWEPTKGITAATLVKLSEYEMLPIKDSYKGVVRKFIDGQPALDEAKAAAQRKRQSDLENVLHELNELATVFELVDQSTPMISSMGAEEDARQLRAAFSFLLPRAIKRMQKAYAIFHNEEISEA